MNDKFNAIDSFWASFGIPAYDENTVPTGDDRPAYPYITYSAAVSEFWDGPVALSGSLWFYGSSWAAVTAKLEEVQAAICRGGKIIPCEDGALWIVPGSPFAQRMSDPNDMIRRILVNVAVEFITA